MPKVTVSKRYEVPANEMWALIGDPGALCEWHPAVETTETLDGGRVRINTVVGGARVAETILKLADRRYTFRIDESPLPLDHFVSTIQVRDDTWKACVVVWDGTFAPNGVSEPEAVEIVRGFFQAGLDAL